ncbi:MAG: hypothetical protein ACK55Z_03475 [bacterium]
MAAPGMRTRLMQSCAARRSWRFVRMWASCVCANASAASACLLLASNWSRMRRAPHSPPCGPCAVRAGIG